MNLFYFNSRFIFLIYSLILIEKTDITKTSIIGRAHLQMQTIFGYGIGKVFKKHSIKSVTLPDCGTSGISNFIVGGLAADNHEFPFIVLILFNGKTSCGGAILNEYWVITAAHCFKDRENLMSSFTINAGSNSIDSGDVYNIARIIVHKKFSFDSMNSDICLLKVNRKFRLSSSINGICLPSVSYEEPKGVLTVAGWGRLKWRQNASQALQKVDLNIITDQKCSNIYSEKQVTIYRSNLCTFTKGRDSCEGDSGGPAFQYINNRATLVGVVSFGWECADSADNYPGVNTQISYFLDWIKENAK